jgi:hypothetical protein
MPTVKRGASLKTNPGLTAFSQSPRDGRMNKEVLRDEICRRLRAQLSLQTGAAALARDEAISEESRPESKYDTHSQEAAYLAEGQARLAGEIEADIARCLALRFPSSAGAGPAAMGSLLEVSRGGAGAWYFLAPAAGGMELQVDGATILVLTPQSPLGRTLLGRRPGETVALPPRGSGRILRVL